MVWHHPHPVAWLECRAAARDAHGGMFLREALHDQVRVRLMSFSQDAAAKDGAMAGRWRKAARAVACQGLAAAIQDDPIGRGLCDNGCKDGEGAVVQRCR